MSQKTMKRAKQQSKSTPARKRARLAWNTGATKPDFFELLPDDLVSSILCKLVCSAGCPLDFFSLLLTCKRLNSLASHPLVLAHAGTGVLSIKAGSWSESAQRFFDDCVEAGNSEACYILGMIHFYCLGKRVHGKKLMATAANNAHTPALYSLAIIQFNASGGSKKEKELRAGVALCARASLLGHIDATRELGHCLKDGYGVLPNMVEARRLLVQANMRELFTYSNIVTFQKQALSKLYCCSVFSDFGFNVPPAILHPANQFLVDWFGSSHVQLERGLRMCSNSRCGRPETRSCEFRRCSDCGSVNYCSRACQALDWKVKHKTECPPLPQWVNNIGVEVEAEDGEGEDDTGGAMDDPGEVVDEPFMVLF